MKKLLSVLLILVLVLSLTACGNKLPKEDGERNKLYSYVDGEDVTDKKSSFDDIKACFTKQTVAGKEYYASSLKDYCAYDISSVKAAYVVTTDGYVKYYADATNLYLLAFEKADGASDFTPIKGKDGKSSYGIIENTENASAICGVETIYMVTTPSDFSVSIQVNGVEVGKLTMSDFMKKTAVGDNKVSTAMFEGSFKYDGGAAEWKGSFLGIDMDTMIAKLNGLGMEVPAAADCKNIEFTGYIGMGVKADKVQVNQNYSKDSTNSNYFGNVQFYTMYDGITKKASIKETELGLTCFINGTGSKWITYNLESINFVKAE